MVKKLSFQSHIQPNNDFSFKDKSNFVLITGSIGSGKTRACELLVKEFGYTLVPCSRILSRILKSGHIAEIGRPALQYLGYEYINKPGAHKEFAKEIAKFIKDSDGEKFVLDGLRYPQTLEELKEIIKKPIAIIYIETTIDSLYKNYKNRIESKGVSFTEFLEIINDKVEREIKNFHPIADITIYNHGTLKSYLGTLSNYLTENFNKL